MRKFILLILILCAWVSWDAAFSQSPDELISRSYSVASRIQNGIYTAITGIKYPVRSDTIIISGKVRFEKNPKDSVVGCRYDILTTSERYLYDGSFLVSAYLNDSLKVIHDRWIYPLNTQGKQPFRLLYDYFTGTPFMLKELMNNRSVTKKLLNDSVIGKSPCYVIQTAAFDKDDTYNNAVNLFIAKSDFMLLGYSISSEYLNRIQFQYQFITDYSLNLPQPDRDYSGELIPEMYYSKRYTPDEIERLLPIGFTAPSFTLKDTDNHTFYSGSANGKIMVLFFWHMFSPESRQALAVMEKLSHDLEGMGVILLGMNVKEPDLTGMLKFLKHRDISFRQLLDARVIALKYNVHDYPAFYVIGRNGKVLDSFYDMKNADSRIELTIKRNLN
ncbi:MAG: TlpA family protein disulfide reductase [Bacteroidia bacterium]|nr:TlpA family protein disulfide reductase [Bacteroidia bacterium]